MIQSYFSWPMKRFIYSILLFIAVLQQICAGKTRVAPDAEPLALVYGCVNVISGSFVQNETDLVLGGPSPLIHTRIYDSGSSQAESGSMGFGFTRGLARSINLVGHDKEHSYAVVEEREGVGLHYKGTFHPELKGMLYLVNKEVFQHGYTNYSPGNISGANDLHNVQLLQRDNGKHFLGGSWEVTLGCGTRRRYRQLGQSKKDFEIVEEIRPDGNRVHYRYSGSKLTKAWLSSADDDTPLISYSVDYQQRLTITTGSNGQTLRYVGDTNRCWVTNQNAQRLNIKTRLARVESSHLPLVEYNYPEAATLPTLGHLTKIMHPEGRHLEINYNDNNGKVSCLKRPVNVDGTMEAVASFLYKDAVYQLIEPLRVEAKCIQNAYCDVFGPHNECTRYIQQKNRITSIQSYLSEGDDSKHQLYREHCFYWSELKSRLGCLTAKVLCDHAKTAISGTYFEYDQRGNVQKEIVVGNLSGCGPNSYSVNEQAIPLSPVEYYAVARTFLPVFNVVTSEQEDNGLRRIYEYKSGTNLVTACLKGNRQAINHREFFEYDKYANQIRHVIDGGSGIGVEDLTGVRVRLIKEMEPVVTPLSPAFGKPMRVSERYLGDGKEELLRSVVYQYDERGYPVQETLFDANRKPCYTLERVFDHAGRVLEETNPIGHKTVFRYDLNGNLVCKCFVEEGIRFEYVYDCADRLIKESEINSHCIYETSHCYDRASRKIATIDPFGNETLYSYDDLDRVTSIVHSKVRGECRIERFEYDLSDNKVASHDVLGNVTRSTYTARGQPVCVSYPDGSVESYEYHADGSLYKHTTADGVITTTHYDEFRKPCKKEVQGADGSVYFIYSQYRGELLLSETDANGVETTYAYDGAGRLVELSKADQRTQYVYDSLGRQKKVIEWAAENMARVTIRVYDVLNRVVEEKVQDLAGNLASHQKYSYDLRGNRALVVSHSSQGIACTKTEYDSRNRPIEIVDALGNKTVIEYDDKIFQTTITDALGNQSVTTRNSLQQVIEVQRKDILGNVCASSVFAYDLAGRQVKQCDANLINGVLDRLVVTEWIYDCMNRLITLTEAVGKPEQKCTTHSYNQRGQKEIVLLPDGTRILHAYDEFGRLQRYRASDNSFDYLYEYDLNGNVVSVADRVNDTITQRCYDAHNRLSSEILANGLMLNYLYDAFGRILEMILPDKTSVNYTYNACHLTTASRVSAQPYEHKFTHYDLSGALLEEQTPAGTITYEWDLLNRPRAIRGDHFTELIPEDGYDKVGNLLCKTRADAERKIESVFTYDALYQLRSEQVTDFDPHSYVYDSLNNRRGKDEQTHTVNALNQLLSVGDTVYAYDQRGNLVSETSPESSVEYAYDALGRLTSLVRDGVRYQYQYDAFNRRIKKSSEYSEERYLYVDQNEIGSVDSQGKIRQLRVLGLGKGAERGSAIALELEENIYIPIHDHAGHVSVLIDLTTKNFAEGYAYTAFGEEQRYGVNVGNPWHFSSKRLDPESGWIYFGRRYYDPRTGRWTTPDPLGSAEGPNLYAYVLNNPLTHFDLYGLYSYSEKQARYEARRNESRREGRSYQGLRMPACVQKAVSAVGAACRKCATGVLQMVSNSPVPIVREAAVGMLKLIDPANANRYHEYPSCVGQKIGFEGDAFSMSYMNGQCNTLYDAQEQMDVLSQLTGGMATGMVHKATHGFSFDLAESFWLKAGLRTDYVKVLARQLTEWASEAQRNGTRHIHYCHSQATFHLYLAAPLIREDLRKFIDVVTFGAGKIIPNNLYGSTVNYIARRDGVPMTDTIAYIKCLFGSKDYNVKWVGSYWGVPFVDHAMSGTSYTEALREDVRGRQNKLMRG